jgi:hypothetical protein
MRHAGWRAARASYARDKPEATFLVSGTILVGCRPDVWRDRQTDGEDQHVGQNYVITKVQIAYFTSEPSYPLVKGLKKSDTDSLLDFFLSDGRDFLSITLGCTN